MNVLLPNVLLLLSVPSVLLTLTALLRSVLLTLTALLRSVLLNALKKD